MLSIHNNLSAGAQNVTDTYVIIMLVYKFTSTCYQALTWESSCVIANNAQKHQKLFVQGYNLKFMM